MLRWRMLQVKHNQFSILIAGRKEKPVCIWENIPAQPVYTKWGYERHDKILILHLFLKVINLKIQHYDYMLAKNLDNTDK